MISALIGIMPLALVPEKRISVMLTETWMLTD